MVEYGWLSKAIKLIFSALCQHMNVTKKEKEKKKKKKHCMKWF